MSFYKYKLTTTKLTDTDNSDQWLGIPVHLEELPKGLIEDEV